MPVRMLRLLGSVGVVTEVGPETYQATEFCHHSGIANVKDVIKQLSVFPNSLVRNDSHFPANFVFPAMTTRLCADESPFFPQENRLSEPRGS